MVGVIENRQFKSGYGITGLSPLGRSGCCCPRKGLDSLDQYSYFEMCLVANRQWLVRNSLQARCHQQPAPLPVLLGFLVGRLLGRWRLLSELG